MSSAYFDLIKTANGYEGDFIFDGNNVRLFIGRPGGKGPAGQVRITAPDNSRKVLAKGMAVANANNNDTRSPDAYASVDNRRISIWKWNKEGKLRVSWTLATTDRNTGF